MDEEHERLTLPGSADVAALFSGSTDEAAGAAAAERECLLQGDVGTAGSFYDVLAFLSRARSRGELVVTDGPVMRVLYFDEGYVVGAESTAPEERLGEVLARAGVLTREQVTACDARMKAGRLRFGEAAVELGFVRGEALFRAMKSQIDDVFCAVAATTRGTFTFHAGFDEAALSFRHRRSVDTLLASAVARIEETAYFTAKIPSDAHVPTRAADRRPPPEDKLGIYAAADGRRSVAEIREASSATAEIEFMRALFEHVQAGYLTIEPPRIPAGETVKIYNRAIALLLGELDALGLGERVRTELAAYAAADTPPAVEGAQPAADGTFDVGRIAERIASSPDPADAEDKVGRWLYDYASYAIFLARPHLDRRDQDRASESESGQPRLTKRVAALLEPLAPTGDRTEVPPEDSAAEAPPSIPDDAAIPRFTAPVVPEDAATASGTRRLPKADLARFPGIDPSRTVRMAPLSEQALARRRAEQTSAARRAEQTSAGRRTEQTSAAQRAGRAAEASQTTSRRSAHRAAAPPSRLPLPAPLLVGGAFVVGAALASLLALALLRPSADEADGAEAVSSEVVVVCEPACDHVYIDGTETDAPHGTFPLAAGAHEIVASRLGYATQKKRVELSDGESRPLVFTLARPSDDL